MTTKVRIEPSGHHVLVSVIDKRTSDGAEEIDRDQFVMQPAWRWEDDVKIQTGQQPWVGYATTTRTIAVVDLEPSDPHVEAASGTFNWPVPK